MEPCPAGPSRATQHGVALHGSGRQHLTNKEFYKIQQKYGLDQDKSLSIGLNFQKMTPFIVSCSATAKILQFDGDLKPWNQPQWERQGSKAPLCELPGPL